MDSLITLLKEAAGASIQPRTDSLALAVAARAAAGRKWLEKCAYTLQRIQVRRAERSSCALSPHMPC